MVDSNSFKVETGYLTRVTTWVWKLLPPVGTTGTEDSVTLHKEKSPIARHWYLNGKEVAMVYDYNIDFTKVPDSTSAPVRKRVIANKPHKP